MGEEIVQKVVEPSPEIASVEERTLQLEIHARCRGELIDIFRTRHAQLIRFARIRILNHADAEDLVQEAFISASRAYPDKQANELLPLLFTILRNLTRDYLKSGYVRSRQTSAEIMGMGDRLVCHQTVSPEQKLVDRQLLAIAQAAMDNLGTRQRQTLELHRLEGLTHNAIARRLGVSPRTVRNDIDNALAAVAKALSRSGAPRPDRPE